MFKKIIFQNQGNIKNEIKMILKCDRWVWIFLKPLLRKFDIFARKVAK